MSLADRFSSYKAPSPGPKCVTCHLVASLPKADAAALQKALDDPSVSNAAISEILRSEDHQVAETSVRRHRRGMCRRESE